jgi:hypothetical protein
MRQHATLVDVQQKAILKVTKWLRTTPAIAVCSFCSHEFKVPLTQLTRTKDAQAYLQQAFDRHKCPGAAEIRDTEER